MNKYRVKRFLVWVYNVKLRTKYWLEALTRWHIKKW